MNTRTNHKQLKKQEAEIWTLLQTMNSFQNKRQKYKHCYKPWTARKTRGWNMNTPTNHKQLKKQEAEIWTLLQTMNSSQNKRQKYEHSYKPWTTLKTRGRNMNTPTFVQTMNSSQIKSSLMNTETLVSYGMFPTFHGSYLGNLRLFNPSMEYFKTKRCIHCQSNYYSWNTFLLRILNKNEYNGFTVLYEINEFHSDVIYTPLSIAPRETVTSDN
jgi:hypothetical protein